MRHVTAVTHSYRTTDAGVAIEAAHSPEKTNADYTVTVVGLGYVGLPYALHAIRQGYSVRGVDINTELIRSFMRGKTPSFLSSDDARFMARNSRNITYSDTVVGPSSAFIVCVPTPVRSDKIPDLAPLLCAARMIAPHIRHGSLIVIESTVNPGVCEEVILPILEETSGLVVEEDFYFAHCPERINPGDSDWSTATIPRVLGASGPRSEAAALGLYASLINAPIKLMKNIKEAEAVKMVENSFRDINIAFVNELAMSFKKAGIDIVNVIEGASTKPFGFMAHYPGCGVGGHCIPVDPYYLIDYGKKNGFSHKFLEIARTVNNGMPHYTVSLLEAALADDNKTLDGATVALLGLSYKRNTPDLRESPALEIATELKKRGAHVTAYDPHVPDHSDVDTLEEALRGADAAVIATNHAEFEMLTPQTFTQNGISLVIDGRNCLNKDLFVDAELSYVGIGR